MSGMSGTSGVAAVILLTLGIESSVPAAAQPLSYSEMLQKPLSLRPMEAPAAVQLGDGGEATAQLPEAVQRLWLELDRPQTNERPLTQHEQYCLKIMAGDKQAQPPIPAACPNEYGKNLLCEAECPVALAKAGAKNCSHDVIDAFCNSDLDCNPHGCQIRTMFSPTCHAKLVGMIDIFKPKQPPDASDITGRRLQPGKGGKGKGGKGKPPSKTIKDAYQALSSWSSHMGIHGHFYQCVALDTYYFWQAHFYCNGEKPPLGYQDCSGKNQYIDLELDLCVPAECNNQRDVRAIANAYAQYGLAHSWLNFQYAHQPMAPPLNAVGYHGVPIVAAIAVLAALCIIATLCSATGRDWLGLTGCNSATPMEENVIMRAKNLLDEQGNGAMSCSEVEDAIKRMSRSELWQFVQDGESARSGAVRAPTIGVGGNSLQGTSIVAPLLVNSEHSANGSNSLVKPAVDTAGICGFFNQALACWDMGENFRTGLRKKDGGVPEMRILNGLRVLSMGWVVLGHTYLYMNSMAGGGVANQAFDETIQARLPTIMISNGQFSVDTFFVLSGFLGAYVGLRKLSAMDKAGKKAPSPPALAFAALVDRWLRLTPLYLFMLMVYMFLIPHVLTGPAATWDAATQMDDYTGPNRERDGSSHNGIGRDYDFCKEYIWTNLLYITNMYPNQFANSMKIDRSQPDWYKHIGGLGCMGHSWYLSVDFQLHMLTPWLLCLFRWRPTAGYVTMTLMILGSLGYLLFLVLHADYNMCEAEIGAQRTGTHHFEGNENTLEYNKPWTRCGPFLLGVMLACYQSQTSNKAGHMPAPRTVMIVFGYLAALVTMAVAVFSPWWARPHGNWMDNTCQWNPTWDAIYIIFRRSAWGAAVAYFIYAALTCKGGPIARFLSWNFWTPFARLTYGWYLCHPLWMQVIFGSNPNPLNFYDLLGVAYYITNCVVGLLISTVCFFLVEAPLANLKALVMPKVFKLLRC